MNSCKGICIPPESEGISRQDALLSYTINGAAQLGIAAETGSIETGKSADFAILDRDIMTCSLDELKDTVVRETFLYGRDFADTVLRGGQDGNKRCSEGADK